MSIFHDCSGLVVRSAAGRCAVGPGPFRPLIHTAVVPELPGGLNGIDAGLLPPGAQRTPLRDLPKNAGPTPSKPMASGQRPGIPPRQCTAGTRACLGSFLHVSAIIF